MSLGAVLITIPLCALVGIALGGYRVIREAQEVNITRLSAVEIQQQQEFFLRLAELSGDRRIIKRAFLHQLHVIQALGVRDDAIDVTPLPSQQTAVQIPSNIHGRDESGRFRRVDVDETNRRRQRGDSSIAYLNEEG